MKRLAKTIIVGAWVLVALLFVSTFVIAISQGVWYALLAYLGIPLALAISWAFHYDDARPQ